MNTYTVQYAWALDFLMACADRPLWSRLLLRIALGKYAYSEFVGLAMSIHPEIDIKSGYMLQRQDYHKDKLSSDWLKNIKPRCG